MAHLRQLETKCCRCKVSIATCELFNRYNAALGKYCQSCGKAALRMLQRVEESKP